MSITEITIIAIAKIGVVIFVVLTACAYATLAERRLVAFFQQRIGPNVAGPFGLLQPLADGLKLAMKEDIRPEKAEKYFYSLAPLITFVPAILVFAVIPFGDTVELFGYEIDMVISDLNLGILFIFAVTSLGVYGVMLAGWSSGSKYSMMGALRASAQMISYEVSYGLSIIGVLLLAQTFSLKELVAQQVGFGGMYVWSQPVGFGIFIICAIAETNRSPFDMAEAESELVAGYLTEYSSMRFGIFSVAEYAHMIAVSAVATTIFFGGWQTPFEFLDFIPPVMWFAFKVACFMFFYFWLRATLPRFRYDQLMNFGWKILFPLALLNTMATAGLRLLK